MIKKLLCLLTSLAILCTCAAGFTAAATGEPDLKLAVASDLHYNIPPQALSGDIDDEIYWYANRRAAMENESGFIIDEFLRQCAENDSDYVLISGDLVDSGRTIRQQHLDVAEKLAAFEQSTGKQVFVIDGNHDLGYDSETDVEDFKQIYAPFGYEAALTVDEDSCSYTTNLGEKYRLIALDSCDHSVSTADGLTLQRLIWLRTQAKQAQKDGRYIILMMHHNLLDHMPMQSVISGNFIIRNHRQVADLFANLGIRIVLTGHEHCSDVSGYTSSLGNQIYDFATTSLTMYPLQYRLLSFTDDEIRYSTQTVDSIDTAALSGCVDGYSAAQLDSMNSGLNNYALGFLQAGIRYRLELSLSMEKIGIAEGEPLYKLVNTAVGGLTEILAMPLYGETSATTLAQEYNIDLPQSNYRNGWELVTSLVAAHYAGGENKELDSTEVSLILRLAALILRSDLSDVADEVFLSTANSLLSKYGTDDIAASLTKLGTEVFGAVTPGEYFILAVASPLIFEFAYDSDNIDDNNGAIPGCTPETKEAAAMNIEEKIKAIFSDLLFRFSLFIKYIF